MPPWDLRNWPLNTDLIYTISLYVTFFGKMDTNAFSLNGQEKWF